MKAKLWNYHFSKGLNTDVLYILHLHIIRLISFPWILIISLDLNIWPIRPIWLNKLCRMKILLPNHSDLWGKMYIAIQSWWKLDNVSYAGIVNLDTINTSYSIPSSRITRAVPQSAMYYSKLFGPEACYRVGRNHMHEIAQTTEKLSRIHYSI